MLGVGPVGRATCSDLLARLAERRLAERKMLNGADGGATRIGPQAREQVLYRRTSRNGGSQGCNPWRQRAPNTPKIIGYQRPHRNPSSGIATLLAEMGGGLWGHLTCAALPGLCDSRHDIGHGKFISHRVAYGTIIRRTA